MTLRSHSTTNRHSRRSELARLRDLLQGLEQSEPAMASPLEVMARALSLLKGRAFKWDEDLLDSAICAYIAYYAWYRGPGGYEVYGDPTRVYILVPMTAWMRQRLAEQSQLMVKSVR